MILDCARRRVHVKRSSRNLEERLARGDPELADHEDVVVGVDREDRDRTRMADDLAFRP